MSGEVHCFSVNMDAESEVVYLSHGAHNELVTWEVTDDKLTLSLMSRKTTLKSGTGRYGDQPDFTKTGVMTIDKSGDEKRVSATGSMVPIDHRGLLWNWDFDESEMPREYTNRGQGSERYMRLWTNMERQASPGTFLSWTGSWEMQSSFMATMNRTLASSATEIQQDRR